MSAVAVLDGRLVSASADHTLRIWAPGDDGRWQAVHTLEGHSDWVHAVAVLDHNRIVSASDDHSCASGSPATAASGAPRTLSKDHHARYAPSLSLIRPPR
ncbi:MAG: hypothetical protein H6926_03535 [Chromatiales bacterium]|nr:hypothetical protein [Chromatiales bacterium]